MYPVKPYRSVEKELFGYVDGKAVLQYTLANHQSTVVKLMTYGAAITSIRTPDRTGHVDDIVLGFDELSGYLTSGECHFGAIVGRVANRIAGGHLVLNATEFQLTRNEGEHHLHGGYSGFDRVFWSAREMKVEHGDAVTFGYFSRNGEEGYPGNCYTEVTYSLGQDNTLWIRYEVASDEDTPINLTNHSYFNLGGSLTSHVLDHELMIQAEHYTPVGADRIPTGEVLTLEGTPLDFRSPISIGARLSAVGGHPAGYDHNYVIDRRGRELALVARVYEPATGRTLEVHSTEPGVQLYTSNFLDGSIRGKDGIAYGQYAGLCLETQHFPDSIHHPNFPSTILSAGNCYRSTTAFRFGAR
jgi:aldose 1-epimerase